MDYSNHQDVMDALKRAMDVDHDNRERGRECQRFLAARDGQWEPEWSERAKDKPRYTFDMTEAIVDQIIGDIEQSDLDTRTVPVGGEASEDIADTYNGLLRSIKARSFFEGVRRRATRNAVISGFDAVRAVTKYCDGYSTDQDIAYEAIPNAIDRVYFGYHSEPDASDANHCWILTGIDEDDYKQRFPDQPASSVGYERQSNAFFHKPGLVIIGEVIWLEDEPITLVKMTDGSVHVDSEDFRLLADEFLAARIEEKERTERTIKVVKTRRFTASDWIDDKPRESPFKHRLPVVPLYGCFEVIEDKVVYRGAVEKLIDPQRVMNYSLSREIEEGALAPRAKYWMTRTQAEGEHDDIQTLNVNPNPVQFYTPDPEAPGAPQQQGGAMVNPGLRNISQAMQQIIGVSAGMFAANLGDNPGLQSGVAIEALQDRGDRGNNKYLAALEVFERALCKSIISAIPQIYTPDRQVRLLSQDGSVEVATIGQMVTDRQTRQRVRLHDVSRGTYEVVVKTAPSFQTRQSETVKAIMDLSQSDPTIIQAGADILLSNIPTPGMDQLAARKRRELFQAGMIPYDQMTEEEQAEFDEVQNQPPQESPEMVLAMAEQAKADAEAQKAQADFVAEQNKQLQIQVQAQSDERKANLEAARLRLDAYLAEIEAEKTGMETRKIYAEIVKTLADAESTEADTDAKVTRIDEVMRGV